MVLPNLQEDPWTRAQTIHGFAADELYSVLQKSIRRGLVDNALIVAYEMYASGEDFEDQVWRRLQIISVEDVGYGRLDAPVVIRTLDEFRKTADRSSPDRLIYLVHATRFLTNCPKDRTSDEMTNWVRNAVDSGAARPEVFDDAIDMHTKRGQEMGRGFRHWFANGARVTNEIPDRDLTYHERVLAMLDRQER